MKFFIQRRIWLTSVIAVLNIGSSREVLVQQACHDLSISRGSPFLVQKALQVGTLGRLALRFPQEMTEETPRTAIVQLPVDCVADVVPLLAV